MGTRAWRVETWPTLCAIAGASALLAGCQREYRDLHPGPETGPRMEEMSDLRPDQEPAPTPDPHAREYEGNAFHIANGQRDFYWFNCSGCHFNGGGGIGPALMDEKWKYGGDPASIFATITQGRPGGMPSFGGHIPDDQVWQIVAYVRSMSGQLSKDVAPSRSDGLYAGPPENTRRKEPVK